jgi:hypothetical protein
MPLNPYRFYLGPLGAMQAMPPMTKGSNPASTAIMIGAEHVGLNAHTTFDIGGFKRQWPMSFSYRYEAELQNLIAAFRRISVGPFGRLRLLTARRTNCLSGQVSSGGSEKTSTSGFTASAGTLAFAALVAPSPPLTNLSGGQSWVSTTAGQTLLCGATETPVVPGASYLFSAFAAGTGTYTPTIQPYDIAGTPLTAVTGAGAALAASWPSVANGRVGRYTPSPTVASFAVGWTATGAGTCNTTGWQVQIDPVSSTPAPFVLGVGVPSVYIRSMTEGYPSDTKLRVSSDLLLQEV